MYLVSIKYVYVYTKRERERKKYNRKCNGKNNLIKMKIKNILSDKKKKIKL